jgi:phosphopantetheine--protein transferase-like protein
MNLIDSISIGVDIVSVDRISNNAKDTNSGFIKRIYTQKEVDFIRNKENISQYFAGRLAAKEAVCKALKLDWSGGINWKDIEILSGDDSIPVVRLHGHAKKVADERKITNILLSISHEKDYAIAFAVTIGNEEK